METPNDKLREHTITLRGVTICPYQTDDFPTIKLLSDVEGWPTPTSRPADTLNAWQHSYPALVAIHNGQVIGFLRAITDGSVTTYIAELLVAKEWRSRGIGKALVEACHEQIPSTRLDLLSTGQADLFYEATGFRRFQGFRKSAEHA